MAMEPTARVLACLWWYITSVETCTDYEAMQPPRNTQRINASQRSSERKCRQFGHRNPKCRSAAASTYSGQQDDLCPCERRTGTRDSPTAPYPYLSTSLACRHPYSVKSWPRKPAVLCACVAGARF